MCAVTQASTSTRITVLIDTASCRGQKKGASKTAIIVGSVVGGVIVVTVALILLVYLTRHSNPFFKHGRKRGNSRRQMQYDL